MRRNYGSKEMQVAAPRRRQQECVSPVEGTSQRAALNRKSQSWQVGPQTWPGTGESGSGEEQRCGTESSEASVKYLSATSTSADHDVRCFRT